MLAAPALLALAQQCAPAIHPQTILAIVKVESGGKPLAINVNGAKNPPPAANVAEAAQHVHRYIKAGYSVDIGLGQINSRNLRWLGLTVEKAFEPCANLAAAAKVLHTNYNQVRDGREPQTALRMALSMYNTGSPARGFSNGYVAKVVGAGSRQQPFVPTTDNNIVIVPNATSPSANDAEGEGEKYDNSAPWPKPNYWDVFARPIDSTLVTFKSVSE